jgi:hypothetical protein
MAMSDFDSIYNEVSVGYWISDTIRISKEYVIGQLSRTASK